MPSLASFAPVAVLAAISLGIALACDRGMAPFDPEEQPTPPDLARIFPDQAALESNTQSAQAAEAPSAPDSSAAAGGAPVRGEIRIDSSLGERVPDGALLFVIARAPGGGPPLAVKRVEVPAFPYPFEISAADRMITARPFTGPFTLSAWIDVDGNVMTRGDGDLQGQAEGSVEPGDDGVEIVIDEAL